MADQEVNPDFEGMDPEEAKENFVKCVMSLTKAQLIADAEEAICCLDGALWSAKKAELDPKNYINFDGIPSLMNDVEKMIKHLQSHHDSVMKYLATSTN